ncbi:MAG TPA: hypothetical protein VKQ72_05875 [Aggregatilineales bacterium]|nr:hypothetical protein [Aggregatilineales bacterium]
MLVSSYNDGDNAMVVLRDVITRKNLRIWRHGAIEKPTIGTGEVYANDVHGAAITVDNQTLATGGTDNIVNLWRISDGTRIASFEIPSPVDDPIQRGIYQLMFSHNGTLLSVREESSTSIWDVQTRQLLVKLPAQSILGFSPDDSQVALMDLSQGGTGAIGIYKVADGSELRSLTLANYGGCRAAISPDWQTIASCQLDAKTVDLVLYHARDGSLAKVLAKGIRADEFDFSNDGKLLATAGQEDCTNTDMDGCLPVSGLYVWRLKDGAILLRPPRYQGLVNAMAFKPDNSIVFVAFDNLVGGRYPVQWRLG